MDIPRIDAKGYKTLNQKIENLINVKERNKKTLNQKVENLRNVIEQNKEAINRVEEIVQEINEYEQANIIVKEDRDIAKEKNKKFKGEITNLYKKKKNTKDEIEKTNIRTLINEFEMKRNEVDNAINNTIKERKDAKKINNYNLQMLNEVLKNHQNQEKSKIMGKKNKKEKDQTSDGKRKSSSTKRKSSSAKRKNSSKKKIAKKRKSNKK